MGETPRTSMPLTSRRSRYKFPRVSEAVLFAESPLGDLPYAPDDASRALHLLDALGGVKLPGF
jgi:hypothetical protein